MNNYSIDVHHHLIPPAFIRTMDKYGIDKVAGAPLPPWNAQRSIEAMDLIGTQTAITSLSAPGVYFGHLPEACDLARACNEFSAEIKQQHAGRFGSFAVLPMPFTAESCREAEYALDVLQADGIVLLGSTEGVFLGDPSLEELMHCLNERQATVFIHPNIHESSNQVQLNIPGFILEFLCDTTRASVNLVASGVLERYPKINWILAHAGGFLPYVAWRVSLCNMMPELAEKTPQGFLHYIRRFYFDTALSPSPYAMAALSELADPSHILFGSDFPFAPKQLSILQRQNFDELKVFSAEQKSQILRENALALFPQFKVEADHSIPELQRYSTAPFGTRLRHSLMKPMLKLGENMRKR
ncbi:amidohydrolase [Acinetobacter sp. ANC 4945]|uniref:Amidohydrolase n=1 Tax=Acinetobacter amyesii TaxID=2942470 RepID=A0A1T1GUQ6_9GAMM|nr:amidohydrolase family protein [Acinetobacter amyesii]MCL6247966.1 amidohydrolase [Acinetobacter amyesii]OOV81177.1 amidohydrolase [Acinetobacter amyesii]